MPKLTPAEAREKHARRLKGATEDIRRGVQRVTEAPGKAAAKKVDKMRQNILASLDDGTWEARVSGVSLEDWQTQMVDKGIPRIAAGIDGAAAKMEGFFEELFVHQASLQNKIGSMSDLTLEDSINRMVEWSRGMSKFKRK